MTRALVVALVLSCWCGRRQRCDAPAGWYVNGARGDRFELAPVLGRPGDDLEDARSRRQLAGPRAGPQAGRGKRLVPAVSARQVPRCPRCATPLLSDGRHLNGDPGQFCDLNELLRRIRELDRTASRK